jgi:sec-independent protein translocase protein TatA
MPVFGFPTLGAPEIILIVLVIVLLFGAKKIPELMRGIGGGIKEFKKAATLEEEPPKDRISEKSEK